MKRRKLFSIILSLLLLVGVMSPGAEAVAGRAKAQPEDGLSLMSFASLVYDMQKTYDGELEPDRVVTYEELNGSHSIGSVNAAVGTVDRRESVRLPVAASVPDPDRVPAGKEAVGRPASPRGFSEITRKQHCSRLLATSKRMAPSGSFGTAEQM